MRLRPYRLRHVVIVVFTAAGIGLLPWTIYLSTSLQSHNFTIGIRMYSSPTWCGLEGRITIHPRHKYESTSNT